MKFSDYIKHLRKSLNMTQLDVSNKIGLSRSYLAKIENGKVIPPSNDIIKKIANTLECSYDKLLKLAIEDRETFENNKVVINNYLQELTTKITKNTKSATSIRKKCLKTHGLSCYICGFNFKDTYGELSKNLIEVHDISYITGNSYNPLDENIIPVCSNCHKTIHALNTTPDKLKDIVYTSRREKLYSYKQKYNIDDYNVIGDKLCIASMDGNLELLKKLLNKIINYNLKYRSYDSLIDAVLEAAIKNQHLNIIDYILNLDNLDLKNMKYSFIASCDEHNYYGLYVFKHILFLDIDMSKVLFYFKSNNESTKYDIDNKINLINSTNHSYYYSIGLNEKYFKVLLEKTEYREHKIHLLIDSINFLPKSIARDIFKYNTYIILLHNDKYDKNLSLLANEIINLSDI